MAHQIYRASAENARMTEMPAKLVAWLCTFPQTVYHKCLIVYLKIVLDIACSRTCKHLKKNLYLCSFKYSFRTSKEVWIIQKGGENRLSETLATTTTRCVRCQYLIPLLRVIIIEAHSCSLNRRN